MAKDRIRDIFMLGSTIEYVQWVPFYLSFTFIHIFVPIARRGN